MRFQYCWLRLVEQLPITGRKKTDARLSEVLSFA